MKRKFSSELARVVADITGDGHLQLDKYRGVVSFYSKNLDEIKIENKRFLNLFDIEGHIYKYTKGNLRYGIMFISKDLAEFLASIGVTPGNKVMTPYEVPKWIIKGSKEIRKEYIRGLFSSEGSVYGTKMKNGKTRWRIEIEQYKYIEIKENGKLYMEQLKSMIEVFGIKCSPVRFGRKNKRKDGTYTIAMKFNIERNQFPKFYKEIGFDNRFKDEKLKKIIAESLGGGSFPPKPSGQN